MSKTERPAPSRGIYLIANQRTAEECNNLVFSIRSLGCRLPIRVIPFDNHAVNFIASRDGVRSLPLSDFPAEGVALFQELCRRMPQANPGALRRFLCWFGEFDEFLYSDNDVVALMNWEELFPYLEDRDLVHADLEYTTKGSCNIRQPYRFEQLAGSGALELAITAGHFLCRRSSRHISDFLTSLAWMEANPDVPVWHDQTLLHIAVALGKWRTLNLCKPPHLWASSWAGHYKNVLDVIRAIQVERRPISHLHYSGGVASGTNSIDEFLLSSLPAGQRKQKLLGELLAQASGLRASQSLVRRAVSKARRVARGSK
jgi:hypothetical protein